MSNKFIIILICSLIMSSCLDKIELEAPIEFDNVIVVQGGIVRVGDKANIQVQIRLISDAKGFSRIIRVKEAKVINHLKDTVELLVDNKGNYYNNVSNSNFNIDNGTRYKIKVVTIDDVVYESNETEIKPTPKIDELKFKIVKKSFINNLSQLDKTDFVELYVDTKLTNSNNEKLLFKYDIVNHYKYSDQLLGFPIMKTCYVSSKADLLNVLLYDATLSSETYFDDFPVYDRKLDYFFAEGYYATVIQQVVDRETFDYFTQINDLNNREGNIYDAPAGKIITNLKNISNPNKPAYGYFYAVEQDTARIRILPQDVGNPKRFCPVPPSERSPCPTESCCDCLEIPGASLTKPPFWQ